MPETRIVLTRGFSALVDPQDYEWLMSLGWNWQALTVTRWTYALRSGHKGTGRARQSRKVYLHRLIVDAEPGQCVRFRNGDTLDCRRENLFTPKVTP